MPMMAPVPAPRNVPTSEVGHLPRMNVTMTAGQQAARQPTHAAACSIPPTHENFPAAENPQDEHDEAEEAPRRLGGV